MSNQHYQGAAGGDQHGTASSCNLHTASGPNTAANVPQDVLSTVFCHHTITVRDRAAARLVCQHWRSAIDDLTVRRLTLRSPGQSNCTLLLLRRFPLLQSVHLGSAVSSSRAAFSSTITALPALNHLTRLSLEFASPAAVHLPSTLHALSRLRALKVSVGCGAPLWGARGRAGLGSGVSGAAASVYGTLQARAAARGGAGGDGGGGNRQQRGGLYNRGAGEEDGEDDVAEREGDLEGCSGPGGGAGGVGDNDDDEAQWGGARSDEGDLENAIWGATHGSRASGFRSRSSRGGGGGRGGGLVPLAAAEGSGAAAAQLRRPPPGLLPLLAALPYLTSLELAHLAVSVPDVLSAVRAAATRTVPSPPGGGAGNRDDGGGGGGGGGAGGSGRGGLQRLVLVGSGVNLTGVGEPAAAAQLAQLQVLSLDSCTGADALLPLLPHLSGLRHLHLAGMDYAWAAVAGYHHRRAGFDSVGDLQQHHHNHHPQQQQLGAHHPAGPNDDNNEGGAEARWEQQLFMAAGPAVWGLGGFRGLGFDGPGGGSEHDDGGGVAAALAAAASGRPLAFLRCLHRLRSLSLAESFLRTVPNRDICGLTAITALDLSGNGLDDLPHGLTLLPRLRRLDVSQNELGALPSWLAQLQSLEWLSCHHNGLERFPTLLYDMPRLSYLAISHNRISWWPVECLFPRQRQRTAAAAAAAAAEYDAAAGPHPHPQHLGGGGLVPLPHMAAPPGFDAAAAAAAAGPTTSATAPAAQLTDIDAGGRVAPAPPPPPHSSPAPAPAEVAAAAALAAAAPPPPCPLPRLTSLDLSCNRLFGLPGGVTALTGLRALRLRDCLSGLDGAGTARAMALLAGLTGLRELDLSSNHLDQHCIVPLSELRSLRQLWLADNGLEELPLGLAQLGRLRLLSLRANRFTEVPVCLRWLTSLEHLDLSCNRLAELPPWLAAAAAPAARHHTVPQPAVEEAAPAACTSATITPSPACTSATITPSPACTSATITPSSVTTTCCNIHAPTGISSSSGGGGSGCPSTSSQLSGHGRDARGQHPQAQPGTSPSPPPASPQPHPGGLVGLRHLDVSQQYSVAVRESGVPHVPPRLEVQPPHCLYGPLQGDLPEELLLLPYLRTLVLQRHVLPLGSRVLRRLRARGVDIVHPRPLRIESLPGAAAAAFTTAAAAGGLLFPGQHPELRTAAAAAAAASTSAAAATAAGVMTHDTAANAASAYFQGPREALMLPGLAVAVPGVAALASWALGLSPTAQAVMLVVVALATRLILYGIWLSREVNRRRQRQRAAAAAAVATAAAAAPFGRG